jgi:hypothetical protein
MRDQRIAGRVVTHGGDGQNARAKRSQIVGGVGPATRDELCLAVFEDQDGRLTRDTGDFAKAKFVGNKIAEQDDSLRGELFDTFSKGKEIDGS